MFPYLHIPGSSCGAYSGGVLNDDCTTVVTSRDIIAGAVTAYGQPFNVEVHTHGTNTAEFVGFNVVYNQVPCGSGASQPRDAVFVAN